MSQEDKIVSKLMIKYDHHHAETEVHYNDYGSRGVVDLVLEWEREPQEHEVENYLEKWGTFDENTARERLRNDVLSVIEVKSEHAINSVTGANEIIRQFKRHREYFFEGSKYTTDNVIEQFWLVFELSRGVFNHVEENELLYQNLDQFDDVGLMWIYPRDIMHTSLFDGDGELNGWEQLYERHIELFDENDEKSEPS